MRTLRLPRTVALAVLAALPAPAVAEPDWLAPVPLGAPGESLVAAGGAAGELITGAVGIVSLPPAPLATRLALAAAPVGDAPAVQLDAAATPGLPPFPVEVRLAANPSGAAVACSSDVLTPAAPFRFGRRAWYRAAGDTTWQQAPALAGDTVPGGGTGCQVAIGPDGTAAVAFTQTVSTAEPRDVRARLVVHADGAWTVPQVVSTPTAPPADPRPAGGVSVAVDGAGNVTVAWDERWRNTLDDQSSDDRAAVLVRTRARVSGVLGAPVDLDDAVGDTAKDANSPRLAVNAAGAAVIAWQSGLSPFRTRTATRLDAAAAFGPVAGFVAPPDTGVNAPRAALMTPGGTAHVVFWSQGNPSSATTQTGIVRRPAGGVWSASQRLGPLGGDSTTALLAGIGEDAVAVVRFGGGAPLLLATRWRAGLPAPDAARDLVEPGTPLTALSALASDHEGGLLVTYDAGTDPAALRTFGVPFDGSPPRIRSLAVPGQVIAGQATALSVDAVDRWSALAPVAWDFGDGTVGTGASIAKAWSAPGAYTVTATVADARGNARSASAQVVVMAPPADGPAPAPPPPPATPPPTADRTRPVVALTTPACGRRTRVACLRFRGTRAAWRVLRGTVRDPGGLPGVRVQVALSRRQGARTLALRAGRFRVVRPAVAARTWLPARRVAGRWTFAVPRTWPAGRYTIRVRALDRAGNIAVVRTRTIVVR